MAWFGRTLRSGIGRKTLVALTGLGLVLFLLAHLIGNLQLYWGAEAFNSYAEALHELSIFPIVEIGLAFFFAAHISLVLWLAVENRRARGSGRYAVTATKQKNRRVRFWASRTMVVGGLLMLAFIVVHVLDFRVRHDDIPNLAAALRTELAEPIRAAAYITGSLLAGWHAFHGIQSSFRSLGIHHPKYTPSLEKLGFALAVLVAAGFASIPIFIVAT